VKEAPRLKDRIVRKWTWTGDIFALLEGHTDYVYSVATGQGENGKLLSCGEDHSAVCLSVPFSLNTDVQRIWEGETFVFDQG
jgi:hypothetical protein